MTNENATQKSPREIVETLTAFIADLHAKQTSLKEEIDALDNERAKLLDEQKKQFDHETAAHVRELFEKANEREILRRETLDFIAAGTAARKAEIANVTGKAFVDELNKFVGKNIGPKTAEKIRVAVAEKVKAEIGVPVRTWFSKETYSRMKLHISEESTHSSFEICIGNYSDDRKKHEIEFKPKKNLARTPEQIRERYAMIQTVNQQFRALRAQMLELLNRHADFVNEPTEFGGMWIGAEYPHETQIRANVHSTGY